MPAHKRKDLASEGNDEENRDDEEMKEEVMNGEIGSEAEKGEEVKDQKEEKEEESKLPDETLPDLQAKHEDSDAEGNSQSSNSACDGDEFVLVKLAEIRKEVQCPICLGIIRKTRTVMECLHRFCRDCIDKSMRLSNNECPACRTHCASRRSLRDDPNFDALISALYPDIDKYEEEELAVSEGEKTRNKKIQESIAETFRRQTEALGKKKSTSGSRARIPRRKSRGRGRSSGADTIMAGSEEEEEEEEALNGNERTKESSSSDDVRPIKRSKRSARNSPAKQLAGNSDENGDENEKEVTGVSSSPLKGGKEKEKEVTGVSLSPLSWGKNGTRSQTRHGASTSLAGRLAKGGRVAKLMDHLKSLDDNIKEGEMHVSMIPLKGESLPSLKMPYLCCKQGLSIQQLCQFVAVNLSRGVEEVEIYAKRNDEDKLAKLEILHHENVISKLHVSDGNLELVYGLKVQN